MESKRATLDREFTKLGWAIDQAAEPVHRPRMETEDQEGVG